MPPEPDGFRATTTFTASRSQLGTLHTIQRTPAGWACSCEGYLRTNCGKHLGAVERRAEREGWAIGTTAPLDRVARVPATPGANGKRLLFAPVAFLPRAVACAPTIG